MLTLTLDTQDLTNTDSTNINQLFTRPARPKPRIESAALSASTAEVTVEMGKVTLLGTGTATVGGRHLAGVAIDVGNPHLACLVPDLTADELDALDIGAPVEFDPVQFPEGVNIYGTLAFLPEHKYFSGTRMFSQNPILFMNQSSFP